MVSFAQIRVFAAIAEELHFGRAAKRLNLTQPPLSRHLHMLEDELGVQLLERTSRSVRLTASGRAFLAEARSLLQQRENAIKVARQASARKGGAVTIGFVGATSYGYLPWLAGRIRTEMAEVEVTFEEMASREQLKAIRSGQIDFGLVRPLQVSEPVRSMRVHREGLVMALPHAHPLALRKRPELRQIEGEPFIMYSQGGPYMRALLASAFEANDVRPRIVQQMSQAQSILSLVSAGIGIAIVPDDARNAAFDNIVFRPVRLGPTVFAELHGIWRNDNRNGALPRLRELAVLDRPV